MSVAILPETRRKAFATCRATFGSGRRTGTMTATQVRLLTAAPGSLLQASIEFCAGGPGTTLLTVCEHRTVAATLRATVSSATGFDVCVRCHELLVVTLLKSQAFQLPIHKPFQLFPCGAQRLMRGMSFL